TLSVAPFVFSRLSFILFLERTVQNQRSYSRSKLDCMNDTPTATSGSARLREVRLKMLHLHQTLLEMERKSFESAHGRVNSGELLQLVINHGQFAWLRMVSALVVQIDEMLDADEPATHADATNLITGARQLFTESED